MAKEKPTTKICKHCKTEIPYDAKVCPQCRKKQGANGCLIVVIVAVALIVLVAAFGGGSSNNGPTKVGEVNSSGSVASSAAETTKPAATEPEQTVFRVGDVLDTGSLQITYTASREYKSTNQFIQPESGNKFIAIDLYVENTGSSDTGISEFSFNCFADGYACNQAYFTTDNNMLSATLSPGRTTSGSIIFEVPVDAENIEIEYEYNILSSKKVIFLYEGEIDSGFVPAANTASSENAFQVGDIVDKSGIIISYLGCGPYNSGNQFIQPDAGNKYVYFEFEFENTSNSDEFVSALEFDCFADGSSCKDLFLADDNLSATISAGRKTTGKVYFEVPQNAEVIELEYVAGFWTSDRVIFAYSE